jgi:hypothetical protein
VTFTPDGASPAMKPIVAGGSFASADSLVAGFGLGKAQKGTLEILWPGGIRNRLYDVHSGERIVFPEIPCDWRAVGAQFADYVACVEVALDGLVGAGAMKQSDRGRFLSSAVRAFKLAKP